MAEPSTRAKWRALRSARVSTPKKCLTGATLSERRYYVNNQEMLHSARNYERFCGVQASTDEATDRVAQPYDSAHFDSAVRVDPKLLCPTKSRGPGRQRKAVSVRRPAAGAQHRPDGDSLGSRPEESRFRGKISCSNEACRRQSG